MMVREDTPEALVFPEPQFPLPPLPDEDTAREILAQLDREGRLQEESLYDAASLLQLVDARSRLPDTMDTAATLLLADMGVTTSTLPVHPGGQRTFRKEYATERQFGKIVGATVQRLSGVPGYEYGDQRDRLMEALEPSRVTGIRVHNPGIQSDGKQQSMYAARQVEIGMVDEESAAILARTMGALLGSADYFHVEATPPSDDPEGPRRAVMIYGNLHEFAVREAGNATCLVGAQLLHDRFGVTLPPSKVPYIHWQANGHTFPQEIDGWMQAQSQAYQTTPLHIAHYESGTDPQDVQWVPVPKWENLLATEVTTIFQMLRDARAFFLKDYLEVHPDADWLKPENHREQHFDPARRLHVTAGTNLMRERISTEAAIMNPARARVPGAWESWKSDMILQVRHHPKRTAALLGVKAAGYVLSGGLDILLNPLESVVERLPSGEAAERWREARQARHQRIDTFEAARPALQGLIRAMNERLQIQ